MQIAVFRDDAEYIRSQKRTRGRRDRKNTVGWSEHEFARIFEYLNDRSFTPQIVLCHGVGRDAGEVLNFKRQFREARVYGTDLWPGNEHAIEHDFREVKESWQGLFNIVYSNSLDHTDDPHGTIQVWLDQLVPGGPDHGLLLIQWSKSHATTDGGDCFGASLHDYMKLFERYGEVYDLIYCGNTTVILVAGRK